MKPEETHHGLTFFRLLNVIGSGEAERYVDDNHGWVKVRSSLPDEYYIEAWRNDKIRHISSNKCGMLTERKPRVGVGVLVVDPRSKILLGKRKGSHGAGHYSLPGGHLEWKESFEECCRRELLEETGMAPKNCKVEPINFTNDIFKDEDLHYVTLFFGMRLISKMTPETKEPNKCEGWDWYSIDALPEPLFLPLENKLKTSAVQRFIKNIPWYSSFTIESIEPREAIVNSQ